MNEEKREWKSGDKANAAGFACNMTTGKAEFLECPVEVCGYAVRDTVPVLKPPYLSGCPVYQIHVRNLSPLPPEPDPKPGNMRCDLDVNGFRQHLGFDKCCRVYRATGWSPDTRKVTRRKGKKRGVRD